MKKIRMLATALALALGMGTAAMPAMAEGEALATPETAAATPETAATLYAAPNAANTPQPGDVVVLYTNDVHNAYLRDADKGRIGYAAIVNYKKTLESQGYTVVLADGGDAIQGEAIGTLSKGSYLVDIMNEVGYDVAAVGNHEFDYGLQNLLTLSQKANYTYLSCNFTDLATGRLVFDAYKLEDYQGQKVAYIGISTPGTLSSTNPSSFQDAEGNYIYGFCEGNNGQDLYDAVQKTIDEVKAQGATAVIAVGHCGVDLSCSPWTSREIVANTTGLTAFLDGHSHTELDGETCRDKAGNTVALCQTGTKLESVGQMLLHRDGSVETGLLYYTDPALAVDDPQTQSFVDAITAKFSGLLQTKVADSGVALTVNDPATGNRIVRGQETNLGDLCADAYRAVSGADIAFVNGGGVRDNIRIGAVTYGDIIAVHPFGNSICMVGATGQQILDALEMSSRTAGNGQEQGAFLQASGISYTVDSTIASTVEIDDQGRFGGVTGARRVRDVLVGGVPLDLAKTYKVASHNFLLKSGGDGLTMFMNDPILQDEILLDNAALIQYITGDLGGSIAADGAYTDPYGAGRIKIVTAYQAPTATAAGYEDVLRGAQSVRTVLPATGPAPTLAPTATPAPSVLPSAAPAATAAPADAHGDIGPARADGTWGQPGAPAAKAAAAAWVIPQTSDQFPMTVVVVVLILSAIAVVALLIWRKNKK